MTSSTKQTLVIVLVLTLLALAAGYFAFNTIRNMNEEISVLTQEIESYGNRESLLRNTDKTAEELSRQIAQIDSYFLKEEGVVPFIELLESGGQTYGVDITIGSVGIVEQEQEEKILSLHVNARGAWGSLQHFISYVENMPYKLSIEKATLARNSAATSFFGDTPVDGEVTATPAWNAALEINVLTLN